MVLSASEERVAKLLRDDVRGDSSRTVAPIEASCTVRLGARDYLMLEFSLNTKSQFFFCPLDLSWSAATSIELKHASTV